MKPTVTLVSEHVKRMSDEEFENKLAARYEMPLEIRSIQRARQMARLAFRPASPAYAEYAGTESYEFAINEADPYGEFLDNYQPWKADIATAFDQFNAPLLTTGAIHAMTKDDKISLAHHFTQYVDSIESRSRVLGVEGSKDDERFQRYNFATDTDAIAYSHELQNFHQVITSSEGYKLLKSISQFDKPSRINRSKYVKRDSQKQGTPFVVFDTRDEKLRMYHEMATRHAA